MPLTDDLLRRERARAEHLMNRVRACVLLLLALAAIAYAPSLTPALILANLGILLPMLGWTIAQHVLFHRTGRVPAWLTSTNAVVDITAVSLLLLSYGLIGRPELAVKSPIFLAYFAILAARPLTSSTRRSAVATIIAVGEYSILVAYLLISGRLPLVANPLDTVFAPGTSILDEGAKILLLLVAGVVATYATWSHERTLRRAVEVETARMIEERTLAIQLQEADKMAALGTLAASIAHEVNNPLAAISATAELLQHSPLTESQRRDAQAIVREARRAASIVRDTLRMSRADTSASMFSVSDIIDGALGSLTNLFAGQRVAVTKSLADDLPLVTGFAGRLEQVVINLAINAVQAMEGRDGFRQLTLTSGFDGTHTWIEVRDSGPGLPDGAEEKIFTRFFTTKPVGKGTGLGLWIVRQTVVEHGGTIEASNSPEGGARFIIRLPVEGVTELLRA
ncbi:MAG: sensor histidine kinase [Gemmatimonadaceae bacterium]